MFVDVTIASGTKNSMLFFPKKTQKVLVNSAYHSFVYAGKYTNISSEHRISCSNLIHNLLKITALLTLCLAFICKPRILTI